MKLEYSKILEIISKKGRENLFLILGVTGAWVSAVIIYYGVMYVMKFIRMTQ